MDSEEEDGQVWHDGFHNPSRQMELRMRQAQLSLKSAVSEYKSMQEMLMVFRAFKNWGHLHMKKHHHYYATRKIVQRHVVYQEKACFHVWRQVRDRTFFFYRVMSKIIYRSERTYNFKFFTEWKKWGRYCKRLTEVFMRNRIKKDRKTCTSVFGGWMGVTKRKIAARTRAEEQFAGMTDGIVENFWIGWCNWTFEISENASARKLETAYRLIGEVLAERDARPQMPKTKPKHAPSSSRTNVTQGTRTPDNSARSSRALSPTTVGSIYNSLPEPGISWSAVKARLALDKSWKTQDRSSTNKTEDSVKRSMFI